MQTSRDEMMQRLINMFRNNAHSFEIIHLTVPPMLVFQHEPLTISPSRMFRDAMVIPEGLTVDVERKAFVDDPYDESRKRLYALLTDEQRQLFEEKEYFRVVTRSGHEYYLNKHIVSNVYDVRNARRLCVMIASIHSANVYDHLAAQLLLLLTDEETFNAKANVSIS